MNIGRIAASAAVSAVFAGWAAAAAGAADHNEFAKQLSGAPSARGAAVPEASAASRVQIKGLLEWLFGTGNGSGSGQPQQQAQSADIEINTIMDMPGSVLIELRDATDAASFAAAQRLAADGYDAVVWTLGPAGSTYNHCFLEVKVSPENEAAAAKALAKYPFSRRVLVGESAYNSALGI